MAADDCSLFSDDNLIFFKWISMHTVGKQDPLGGVRQKCSFTNRFSFPVRVPTHSSTTALSCLVELSLSGARFVLNVCISTSLPNVAKKFSSTASGISYLEPVAVIVSERR